jgi:hypothetical protein
MTKPSGNGQLTVDHRVDKRVAQLVMIRDEIERVEEEQKKQVAPLKAVRDRIIGELLMFLEQTGQKSAKTAEGTVSIKVTYTAPLTDPDEFMTFVRENDAYELMDRRANATACKEYAEEHDGALPPGVKLNSKRSVGVTKS